MKPGDHPDFFVMPPPPGRSRESSLRLDREGRFWHEGRLVEHPGMARAFASWVDRHPVDGRYILNNGFDWSYLEVEDAPFHVRAIRGASSSGERPWGGEMALPRLELTDGSSELLDGRTVWVGDGAALYCLVREGRFPARFSRDAQLGLEPYLKEAPSGQLVLALGGVEHPLDLTPYRPL